MITVRKPEDILLTGGAIEDGTFLGRWHFSFGGHVDPEHMQFGTLRVFNDDTLSPGAVWPLHPHRDIEVVTVCAEGEFRHADENGAGSDTITHECGHWMGMLHGYEATCKAVP